jgi:Raf kinase inhibitor-like YbhB/YbcL family protein
MRVRSDDLEHMQPIPEEFAFGKPGPGDEPVALSANRNPHLAWSEVPNGTRSFALFVVDTDVPTRGDDVNKEGRHVPASLPRTEFFHWVMVDIPPECRELGAGSCAEGVVAHGRRNPPAPPGAKQGINDFTGWFANDPDMAGDYYGYDGPCPPWNDDLLHHYHFRVYALDVPTLGLAGKFTAAAARTAMQGHVLAEAAITGTYTLNAALRR